MSTDHLDSAKGRNTRRASAPADRIVVVDDDEPVRRLLREVFESHGFVVSEASTQAELMSVLKARDVALITLDLSLRREDGLAIARAVRGFSTVPIIMVTARAEDVDRIVGLEIGADDYITKPFNVREVLARVRAVLRRTSSRGGPLALAAAPGGEVARFDNFQLDMAAHELTDGNGARVPLTSAEFLLLQAFVRHPGRVLSRDRLLDMVGGIDAEPLERSIDTIVSRLRRKIESAASAPQLIKTVRGAGYIFTAKTRS